MIHLLMEEMTESNNFQSAALPETQENSERERMFLIIINKMTSTCSHKSHHNTEMVFCNAALFSRIVFTIKQFYIFQHQLEL